MLDEGVAVVTLTRSESTRTHAARRLGVQVTIGDAGDAALLARLIPSIDHVLIATGGLLPPEAAELPLNDVKGTLSPLLTILEQLRCRPATGVTYLSSGGAVYGNPVRIPVREADPVRPISPYAVSRLAGELYMEMYARTYGLPTQIVRCANVYGPGQNPSLSQGAVAVFLHRIAAGLPLRIVGDGSAIRDYVHVWDVSHVLTRIILEQHDVGVLNLGSGRGHTVLEVAEAASAVIGRPAILQFSPARRHDVDAIVLDIAKLSSLIAYEPMGLREGLRRTWSSLTPPRLAPRLPVSELPASPLGTRDVAVGDDAAVS